MPRRGRGDNFFRCDCDYDIYLWIRSRLIVVCHCTNQGLGKQEEESKVLDNNVDLLMNDALKSNSNFRRLHL